MKTPYKKYVALFRRGLLTLNELVPALILAVRDVPPNQFADDLPEEVLAELRKLAAHPPEPEKVRIFRIGPGDRAGEQEDVRRYFEGLRVWQSFFDGTDAPLPT